jgi:membrane-associated phospholipid phosphatase
MGRILAGAVLAATLFACRPDANPVGPIAASRNHDSNSEPLASPAWQDTAAAFVARASLPATTATRGYSLLGVAQYLAVQRAEAARGDRDGEDDEDEGGRDRRASDRGAVGGASAVVLSYLFPLKVQALEDMVTAQRGVGSAEAQLAFARGEVIGRTVGAAIVTRAGADGFTTPFPYSNVPVGGDGWFSEAPTKSVAGGPLAGTRPWFLGSASQFRPGPPPAFGSPAFLAALAEVRRISDTRTHTQDSIATYWALGATTATTAGFWIQVATVGINQQGFSERRATHLYALLSAAMFDAQIACWDAKETYWVIRPWQADHAITVVAAVGKPNHPSYTSGHSCISSSGAEVLKAFFPAQRTRLDAMVMEAGLSRVYGGIHYQFDCDAGQVLGRSVAHLAIAADRSGESVLGGEDGGRGDRHR